MKTISHLFFGLMITLMLASVWGCENAPENSRNIVLSTGEKVGKEAVQGSIAEFSKAIRNDPKFAKAYAGRGAVKLATGDKAGAIADFTNAIELDPKSAGSYTGRGTAKIGAGDLPGAVGDFIHAAKVMVSAMFSSSEEKSNP
ncbi:MAG: hypothetical protein HGB00_05010 [Chlorobiaceae bacterium]|nr:hypothetical protein [Chlorobiaceae bacterium]